MAEKWLERTSLLLGDEKLNKLQNANVLVVGLGGVGAYAAEMIARAGVGRMTIADADVVSESNINRQIIATVDTVGKDKTAVIKDRLLSINPEIKVFAKKVFYLPENADEFDFTEFDYIIDAVDTVSAKLELIVRAYALGKNIVSSMGTGNKLGDDFEIADIKKTSVCPLAKVMRKELKARGINSLTVVYSKETPVSPKYQVEEKGRHIPASISYPPAIAGLKLAGYVIRVLID